MRTLVQSLCVTIFIFLFLEANAAEQKYARLGDFMLENGQVIKDCRIAYRTFGNLNEDKSNVILYPTWFGGTSEHIGNLIGPDKLVDSTNYYIIAVDALGNGISSSPSNSTFQPGKKFPKFSIVDMVQSEFILLTEKLGISHVFCIIGGSMGGMQTFEWLVRYPDFMDKAIPYVSTPRGSAYDLMLWNVELKIIELGRRYGCPADSIQGTVSALKQLVARTPGYFAENNKRSDVPTILDNLYQNPSKIFTVGNYAAQMRAMTVHDVSKPYSSMAAAADRVEADVCIIVSETDHILNPGPALNFAGLIGVQTSVLKNNCGHLAIGCDMDKSAAIIREFLAE